MPSYRVKIQGLATHRDTQALFKFLIRIPGVSTEKVVQGLQHPPFELPPIAQESQAQQIKDTLAHLGAICIIEVIREPIAPIQHKEEWLDGSQLLGSTASYQTAHRSSPSAPSHPHSTPLTSNSTPTPHKPPVWRQWLLIGLGFTVLVLPAVYLSSKKQTIASKKSSSPKSAVRTQQVARPAPANKSTRPGLKQKHDDARNTQASSEQMRDRSRQTTTPRESAQLLQKAVQYNPYNVGAWKELEEKMRESGDTEGAEAARKAMEQALRVQNTLQSVAKAFGNNTQVQVTTASIAYTSETQLDDAEFYDAVSELYDSVSIAHPEKELEVVNQYQNKVQHLRVVPGEPFPDHLERE